MQVLVQVSAARWASARIRAHRRVAAASASATTHPSRSAARGRRTSIRTLAVQRCATGPRPARAPVHVTALSHRLSQLVDAAHVRAAAARLRAPTCVSRTETWMRFETGHHGMGRVIDGSRPFPQTRHPLTRAWPCSSTRARVNGCAAARRPRGFLTLGAARVTFQRPFARRALMCESSWALTLTLRSLRARGRCGNGLVSTRVRVRVQARVWERVGARLWGSTLRRRLGP